MHTAGRRPTTKTTRNHTFVVRNASRRSCFDQMRACVRITASFAAPSGSRSAVGQDSRSTALFSTTRLFEAVAGRKSACGASDSTRGYYSGVRMARRRSRANVIWEMSD